MMSKTEGYLWIQRLRIKWITFDLLQLLAISLSVSLVLSAVTVHLLHISAWVFSVVFPCIFAITLFIKPIWKVTVFDISRFINNNYPEVEESADLLLKKSDELSLLQSLQQHKIEQCIRSIPPPKQLVNKSYASLTILLAGLIISFAITKMPAFERIARHISPNPNHHLPIKENIPAGIASYSTTILPPSYTRNRQRTQKQFTIKAETGAKVIWAIETTAPIKDLKLIFNDTESIIIKPTANKNHFSYTRIINRSGFYQLEIDGKKSDLYQIEIIPDLPVAIKINSPKQQTTIDVGEPQKINLNVSLADDYGIKNAFISATMASGKGEGVSFTEKKLFFNTNFDNKKEIQLNKQIALKDLRMKPGDELYFFINATDNHGQSSRSAMYFVSIVDTTELMSMAGMTKGVNLVPEYFRSQRQIIIDTEKLLRAQSSISTDTFKQRSNELGIDQKLLRLRYGKFLGEESETEIGGEHDDDHDGGKSGGVEEKKFGDVSSIMDKYAHKHDIAEDATFFEPELKAQLKAVLTEMWKSELQLRTYKPAAALPFEYKALRLLKDLQQKSRAYVAKTTVKKAILKPEKRLSGELDKILQPVQNMTYEQKEKRISHLKITLALLENRKTNKKFDAAALSLLNETEKYMIGVAADHPETYLKALTSLRRIRTGKRVIIEDIDIVQFAVHKMIAVEFPTPQQQRSAPASSLFQNYFNNLKKADR